MDTLWSACASSKSSSVIGCLIYLFGFLHIAKVGYVVFIILSLVSAKDHFSSSGILCMVVPKVSLVVCISHCSLNSKIYPGMFLWNVTLPGARIIFWDLRQKFLLGLYHGDVGSSRLESFVPQIDNVRHILHPSFFCCVVFYFSFNKTLNYWNSVTEPG